MRKRDDSVAKLFEKSKENLLLSFQASNTYEKFKKVRNILNQKIDVKIDYEIKNCNIIYSISTKPIGGNSSRIGQIVCFWIEDIKDWKVIFQRFSDLKYHKDTLNNCWSEIVNILGKENTTY